MPASQFRKIIVESIALFFHSFVNTPNSQWRIVLVLTVGIVLSLGYCLYNRKNNRGIWFA